MSHTNFLGIPVEGEITQSHRSTVVQRPVEELRPLLQAVLMDPGILEFGWTQYTPYFNDGEPCEFSVHTPWFRTPADVKDTATDDEEDEEEETWALELSSHPTLADRKWDHTARNFVAVEQSLETKARYARCKALSDAIEGGAFEDALLEAFGDHAEVLVKATGITVSSYEHD